MTYRQPVLTVTANGVTLANVIQASVSCSLSTRVATAQVEVTTAPASLFTWDPVVITMGASAATAAVRFTGYFISASRVLAPQSVLLTCKGHLAKAELLETEEQRDLGHDHAGATDQVMVSEVLYWCGLAGAWTPADAPTPMTGIGGTGKVLGTKSDIAWYKGASGIAIIDWLDKIGLGYWVYDTFDGTIRRTLVDPTPGTSVATFTEGVDIAGATEAKSVSEARNKIIVEGWPGANNDAPKTYTAYEANPFLLTAAGWQWYLIEAFASAMIEKALTADAGDGVSCQEIADWLLGLKNVYREQIDLQTPRDDVIAPGNTITVVAPTRLGLVGRDVWVDGVTISVNGQGFRQQFSALAALPLSEGRNASVLLKTPATATAWMNAPAVVVIVPTTPMVTAYGNAWANVPTIEAGALVAAVSASALAWANVPTVTADTDALLLETGGYLLLEDGGKLLLG